MTTSWPTKPCGNCPFTRGGLKVRLGRVHSILTELKDGGHFHCHKHLDRPAHKRLGCAGSNILALREDRMPVVVILAMMTGHLDISALHAESANPACEVFATSAEMIAAHEAEAAHEHST